MHRPSQTSSLWNAVILDSYDYPILLLHIFVIALKFYRKICVDDYSTLYSQVPLAIAVLELKSDKDTVNFFKSRYEE